MGQPGPIQDPTGTLWGFQVARGASELRARTHGTSSRNIKYSDIQIIWTHRHSVRGAGQLILRPTRVRDLHVYVYIYIYIYIYKYNKYKLYNNYKIYKKYKNELWYL